MATVSRMPPKGSRGWRTCLPRISSTAVVTLCAASVRAADARRRAATRRHGPSMISATPAPAARSISWLPTPNTVAPAADAPSTPTCPTGRCRSAIIPTACSKRPYAWSSKTDCRIERQAGTCGATTGSSSPGPRFRTGSRPPGNKNLARMETRYLARALQKFSGYIALDELYDGPFCVLSLVDNRSFTRLTYRVLEHDPNQNDIRAFVGDFKAHLDARNLKVVGITTDGSDLYPVPLEAVFPDVPHQICEFHVLKEITQAVLHALAKVRKELKAPLPKRPRGRP